MKANLGWDAVSDLIGEVFIDHLIPVVWPAYMYTERQMQVQRHKQAGADRDTQT